MAEQVSAAGHDEVAFVGTPDGLEARLASEAGLPFFPVRARGWDRSRPLSLVAAAFVTSASFVRCLHLLRKLRADVVIGFGGYVSLPLGLAAAFASVPLVLHEQNSVPGVANRVLSRWASAVCVTYPDSIHRLAHPSRALVTGDPVRPSVLNADEKTARKSLKLTRARPVLLVFGGSRGARHLNEATVDLYSRLSEVSGLQVVQVTGPEEIESVRARLKAASGGSVPRWWKLVGYVEDMGGALATADLVVCRAGATTIAEITAVGKAAVLVPYPHATDDHQRHNATPLREAKAAMVVADGALDTPVFGDEVVALLRDAPRRARMAQAAAHLGRPRAAECIADTALEVAKAQSPWRSRMPKTLKPLSSWVTESAPSGPPPASPVSSDVANAVVLADAAGAVVPEAGPEPRTLPAPEALNPVAAPPLEADAATTAALVEGPTDLPVEAPTDALKDPPETGETAVAAAPDATISVEPSA